MDNQCVERVFGRERFEYSGHQCSRQGKVKCDGQWYCTQHDPVRIAEKRKAENERWQTEYKERNEKYEIQRRKNSAWDVLMDCMCDTLEMTPNGWIAVDGSGVMIGHSKETPWDAVLDLVEKVSDG